jgi:hypothetical protein
MSFWSVFHLQELKQLHGLKVSEMVTLFQKPKNNKKLQKLPFLLSNQLPQNKNVCHYVYSPTKEEPFLFYML